jgi:hypothetical protein
LRDAIGFELDGLLKNLGIRLESDERSGALGFANDIEFLHGFAALKLHVEDLPVARHLHLEPFRDGVHAFCAHPVRAAGKLIPALPVFSAGVQGRQHHFHPGDLVLRMDVHRNSPPVVADGD